MHEQPNSRYMSQGWSRVSYMLLERYVPGLCGYLDYESVILRDHIGDILRGESFKSRSRKPEEERKLPNVYRY